MTVLSTDTPVLAIPQVNRDLVRPKWIGIAGLVLMIGVLGGWTATTVIGGAVIASGEAVVEGHAKLVQSLDGGLVDSIAVSDGDRVRAGDVLLRLDPTLLEVNLDISRGRLAAALALQARLQAEQLGARTLSFAYPELPFARPDTALYEASQTEIFRARRAVLDGGREQMLAAFLQFENRREGLGGQIAATTEQIGLIDRDLANLTELATQGLVRQSQLSELQRSRSELIGRQATYHADLAELDSARNAAELETLQAERSFMEGVVTDLRDATEQVEELTLEIVTRSAQLSRVEVRAPVDGIVHEMQISTVGGIVAPGATILEVIPLGTDMEFQLRVDPHSIDQVWPGQHASVVLAALDPQSTPHLEASVLRISPDVVNDPRTGQGFYRVDLQITASELARLGDETLVPGMPIEAYLETGDRTVLSYLMHPLTAHLRRAFRE